MTNIDIRALAKLARLEVSDTEVEKLEKEIPGILGFVETIQKASVSKDVHAPVLHNVMRADTDAHESGIYTKELLEAAPAKSGDRIAVKQVISRKK
ncbi:MAG: Asp-tRNA(Asn)/Glu-tRNA(Gln) amidotransferase subunit GatC [Minisyncoccota bacterium]|jgi:aspartyl/glutamyl-tRNA(Asn/Gln) amidotransferase C subunit